MIQQHTLKCWPAFFDAVACGEKTFELRLDDRGFQKGDELILLRTREDNPELIEYDAYMEDGRTPTRDAHPAHTLRRRITYALHGPRFGLAAGYVILALAPIPSNEEDEDV